MHRRPRAGRLELLERRYRALLTQCGRTDPSASRKMRSLTAVVSRRRYDVSVATRAAVPRSAHLASKTGNHASSSFDRASCDRLDRTRRAYDVHVHGVATRAHREVRGQYAELPLLKAQVEEVGTGLKEEHQPFAVERLGVARDRPLGDRLVGARVPGQERRQRGARQPRDAGSTASGAPGRPSLRPA